MPSIDLNLCVSCMKCVKDCPVRAIDISTGKIFPKCIHCGHCVAICPESAIAPDVGAITSLSEKNIDPEDLEMHFAGLRSVRSFKKEAIPEALISKLINNMSHYSSASNTRLLQITIIQNSDKIEELNNVTLETLIKALKTATSPLVLPFIRIFKPGINTKALLRYKNAFNKQRQANKQVVCYEAPLVMLFHGPKMSESMLEADANIWAANTVSYAKSLGLGSCFIGFIVKAMKRNKKLKASMQIPGNHDVFAALIVGYPKVKYVNHTGRAIPVVSHVE